MEVLLLGHPKSAATRKAQRFFSERRIAYHDRDLRKRAASPNELRRWVDKLGVEAVVDPSSQPYVDQGLRHLSADVDDWLDRFCEEPLLMRLPLVRIGQLVSVGEDVDAWSAIADAARTEASQGQGGH